LTTIACNKESLATDLQLTTNVGVKLKTASKALILEEEKASKLFDCREAVVAFSGSVNEWGKFIEWASDISQKLPRFSDIEFLMLTNRKQIYVSRNFKNWLQIQNKHHSIGTGSQFALGALEAGKSPEEAIKIASKHDIYTGMGVQVWTL